METPPLKITTSCVVKCSVRRARSMGFVVQYMVVAHSAETAPAQSGDHRVGIGAAHLVIGDGVAGLDQFVARGDHHDGGLAADSHPRHAGRGGDRDFGRAQQSTGLEKERSLATVAAAPTDVVIRGRALRWSSVKPPHRRHRIAPGRPRSRRPAEAWRRGRPRSRCRRARASVALRRGLGWPEGESVRSPRRSCSLSIAMPPAMTRSNGGASRSA